MAVPFAEPDARQRIDLMIEMLQAASREREPKRVLWEFGQRLWSLNPIDALASVSIRGLAPGEYKITRLLRRETIDLGHPEEAPDPWRDWASLPSHRGGFIGEMLERGEPSLLTNLDLADDPQLGADLADMRSCVATPIFDGGNALNWNIQFRKAPDGYTEKDLAEHVLNTNLIGSITRGLVAIRREEELKARLQQQIDDVAHVQRSLLPRTLPDIPGMRIAASYLTSDEAGGDYYDFFRMPGGNWGVLIADVSGHGAAAAMVMTMLHAILHGYDAEDRSPAAIMAYANRRLCEAQIDGRFATAFFGVYDPSESSLTFVVSGHNPPRLKRADGSVHALSAGATLPLGIAADLYRPEQITVRLEPGDTVILYTDGITEAFDAQREMFGTDRLDEALLGCSGDPECVVDSVHRAVYAHTGRFDRDDDQTLVAMRRMRADES